MSQGLLDQTTAPPLITYLVRHGAGGGALNNSSSLLGEETVGDTCSRALYLLATTVSCAHSLLWPRLLSFLVSPEFEASLPTLLLCLTHLAKQPHHSPDALPLLPILASYQVTPEQLFTRLLSLCADPASHPPLGGAALSVMGGLGGHISDNLRTREWREQVEQLRRTCVSLAATDQDATALQIWQDTVREFLGLTLAAIANESFTVSLVSSILTEMSCEGECERRLFLVSALGVVLRHCEDHRLITETLNTVLRITNHKNPLEQASLGVCVGSCGASHTQLVLTQLASWLKEADSKKILSIMAMLKSDSGESSACLRGSVIICLGQLCALAPQDVLTTYVDGPVMLHLLNVINSNKHPGVGASLVECISLVCRALTAVPSGFELRQRPLLITHLVHCCDAGTPHLLPSLLAALRDLVLLDPVLEVEERTILLQAALNATHSAITNPVPGTTQTPAVVAAATHHKPSLSHTASSTLKSSLSALSTPRHSITSFTSISLSARSAKPDTRYYISNYIVASIAWWRGYGLVSSCAVTTPSDVL